MTCKSKTLGIEIARLRNRFHLNTMVLMSDLCNVDHRMIAIVNCLAPIERARKTKIRLLCREGHEILAYIGCVNPMIHNSRRTIVVILVHETRAENIPC